MTVPVTPQKTKSAIQKELETFRRQLIRLGNCLLNKTFDLSISGAKLRITLLLILLPILAFLFSLRTHPLEDWGTQISRLFAFLFVSDYRNLL